MGEDIPKKESKKIQVVLRDLDVILRKKLGENLIVDNFVTNDLVPAGENYGSTMLRVDAEIRRDGKDSKLEKLFLVAKMVPPTEFQKEMFDSPFTFCKEIYMFMEIIPAFKTLERECGIPEAEIFDPIPELYGSRLSLDETKDVFDHDAVILMENLKLKNYACGNRKIGVDLEHAKLLVQALARFHALSIAAKEKKPDLFEHIKLRAKSMEFKEDMMSGIQENMMNDAKKVPELLPYIENIENATRATDADSWIQPPIEPWGTIVHTDLWVNNVMFKYNEHGEPQCVKFIDFQNYLYQNPMRDLIFFIFSSCVKEVRCSSHVQDLIDLYYQRFVSHIEKLGCDFKQFSRDSFNEQLRSAARTEFVHCVLMAKVILADTQSDPTAANPELLFDRESTNECLKIMSETTLKFIEENWI